MELKEEQFAVLKEQFKTLKDRSPFYAKKFEGIDLGDVQTQADFEALPFSEKADLRDAYPLGLAAVPESEIVRIHSSSGTTGTPVIIPYTQQDVIDWAVNSHGAMRWRASRKMTAIQITPGYGLWTAGIGFQLGAERLGAMAVPMGPGNTDKQIRFMKDMQSTVLCATSSYALLLAEEIAKRGVRDELNLKRAVIGSERWGHKMRQRIANELGVKIYDIYGLTEYTVPASVFRAITNAACMFGTTIATSRSWILRRVKCSLMERSASSLSPRCAKKVLRSCVIVRTIFHASFLVSANVARRSRASIRSSGARTIW